MGSVGGQSSGYTGTIMSAMANEDDLGTYTSDSEISDNETRWIRRSFKKKVKDVKSDDNLEKGENVTLQARLSRRLLQ